ncbi:cytochrome oxidase assembly protein ShyY1 [Marinicella litoralis]|uniref:SURF1-like protein n=2 Tax=Marinicella litoralis TaxID=644220 RepID=A0A4R6XT20_9GAMM|nr:cytochrome oxidase assembly protein ShyY1 [Marinicella litoralis]
MLWAGFWQLGRAEEKSAINVKMAEAIFKQPVNTDDWEQLSAFDSVAVTGHYANTHFLLDNQIMDGQVGHFVYSAFKTTRGIWLLINRGWVADDQQDFNATGAQVALRGLVADWPRPGVQLGEQVLENQSIQHVTYLPQAQVHGLLKQRLCSVDVGRECAILPVVLKLDPAMEQGYHRKWQLPRMTADKHQAYAVQWFTMSLVLCLIYVVFLRKIYSS